MSDPTASPCPKCTRPMYDRWCEFCADSPDVPNPSRANGIEGLKQRRRDSLSALGASALAPMFTYENYHRQLLATAVDVFLAATGAGVGIQQDLWGPPGASAFLKGAVLPYDQGELNEFLGFVPPTGYCSE